MVFFHKLLFLFIFLGMACSSLYAQDISVQSPQLITIKSSSENLFIENQVSQNFLDSKNLLESTENMTVSSNQLVEEVVPTAPLTPTVPVQIKSQNSSQKEWTFFWETWGHAAYNTTAYQENRGGTGYDKIVFRTQPRIGYQIPFWFEGMTIDPYIGGELVWGGDQEYYFNYLANGVGVRLKLLKHLDSDHQIINFLRDLEVYTELLGQYIINDSGPTNGAPGAPYQQADPNKKDFVWGFRNYKEAWFDHFWWDSFQRLDYHTTHFQKTGYNDWFLLANAKVGYNLLKNSPYRLEQPWNVGPYVRIEMFKNFNNSSFSFENRFETALGFQVRLNLKAENVNSAWVRAFIEFANVSYFDAAPSAGTPNDNLYLGVEFWNR